MAGSAIHRVLRRLAWAAAAACAAGLALFVLAWSVNLRDQPLGTEAIALRTATPQRCDPDDDLYPALAELALPARDSMPRGARVAAGADAGIHPLSFRGEVGFLHPLDGSVLAEATAHRPEIERLLADNTEAYRRYLALLPLRSFCPGGRAPALDPVPLTEGVRRLFLAAVALHVSSGYAHERRLALADLAADEALWGTVLRARTDMMWKMFALASLHADALLVADLSAAAREPLTNEAAPEALAPVFPEADFDVGSGYAAEFRALAAALREADTAAPRGAPLARLGHALAGHFLKIDATENLLARETGRRIAAAAVPARYAAARRSAFLLEGRSIWGLPFDYNPIGQVLAALALPGDDDAMARAWDGAALQRLVRAALEIRRQGLTGAEIPAFLAAHPQWASHPADAGPFRFDARRGELVLAPVARTGARERFGVPVLAPGTGAR